MWSFFKTKTHIPLPGKHLLTDFHAHWLPGLDDGTRDMQQCMDMLEAFAMLGYKKLIATPHIYTEFYPNTSAHIQEVFEQVCVLAAERWPQLELGFAGEYFMDEGFKHQLREKNLLCFSDNKVLVEQGFYAEIPGIMEMLFDMHIKGYQPVLAHPERYLYYTRRLTQLKYIKDAGTEFQMNIGSLTGRYGPEVRRFAIKLLDLGWIDYLASDAHSPEDVHNLALLTWSSSYSIDNYGLPLKTPTAK